MTDITASAPSVPQHRSGSTVDAAHVLLMGIGFQLALLLPTLPALFIDERLLNGISVWSKPLKFQLSLSLNMLTLLVLLPLIPVERRASRLVRWSALTVAVASAFEIAYIAFQSARGVGSHFNVGTRLDAIGYQLMGVGAVTLVAGSFLIGLAIWRSPRRENREGLRLGAAIGFMLGAVLTLITAGVLSSGYDGLGHWVGGQKTDASGLLLLGWSTTGGDLRVPHFFATHIAQALPVLGLMADRLRPQQASSLIVAGAAVAALVVAATFFQAIAGKPFWG